MFKSAPERLKEFFEARVYYEEFISFGNTFLDTALGGIRNQDLILVTAKTGGGKTELVSQIARAAAIANKRVHFFALEASKGEIESRIIYKSIAQRFFSDPDRLKIESPNYQKWITGEQKGLIGVYENAASEDFCEKFKTLFTFYRDKDFTMETFEAQMARIGPETDLIILDHLHYFDWEDDENKAMKATVKGIRMLQQFYGKPVILVAHIRKGDRSSKALIPDLDDIHGSSDISKIATKAIATAPAKGVINPHPHIFPTYFRILKNRTDGSRCRFTGIVGFDIQSNAYSDQFYLGELTNGDQKFSEIEREKYPDWVNPRHGRPSVSRNSSGQN